jgi:outer membrane protein assembly factor BamB
MIHRPLPSPERLQESWRFSGYGPLASQQPLVAAGDRLLGVAGSTLFAVDIFRGDEPVPDAQVQVQGFPYSFHSGGDPYVTAAGGVVYFMDGDELIALRLSDGLPLQVRDRAGAWTPWKPPVLQQVSGLLAAGDRLVAVHLADTGGTLASGFVAVNGERAFGPVAISDLSPGGIGYGDGAVFFVADGRLHAVNVDFGDRRYERTGGGVAGERLDPAVHPRIAGDVVAAAGTALHFFDVRTGAPVFAPIQPATAGSRWSTPVVARKGELIIASNSGEVMAVNARDGTVAWRTALADPREPALLPGQVVVITDGRRMMATLSLADGVVERRMQLPDPAEGLAPVVTNETVFIPDARGAIEARAFARQHAAYFDGRTSRIDVNAEARQFDFGADDFTVEAWIRSSEGGEIVSSHPTEATSQSHGFRLNLGENGELRVAVVSADARRVHAARTRETRANDGEWHHVALIRRAGALLALLDGKSLDVFFRDDSRAGLAIGGSSALTIGAYRSAPGGEARHHFQGLIRELRIWNRALDVATVQNNRHVQLTGTEPRLKGLWSLAEVHPTMAKPDPKKPRVTAVRNAVVRHGARSAFVGAASSPADLSLDRSGFPYLLHEDVGQWPYAGTWAARGEQPVSTPPASTSNAIAFATGNALYGVRRADGRRLWQMDLSRVSAPVADGSRFLVLTVDDGVVAVDAMTGESERVDAFAGLMKVSDARLAPPAVSPGYIAAGAPHGVVRIVDRQGAAAGLREAIVPAPVRELVFAGDRLFALCGADDAPRIAVIDPADARRTLFHVDGGAFTAAHDWLFCVRDGKPTRLTHSNVAAGQVQAADTLPGTITGMAAALDHDLLVVATDRGAVHAFGISDLAPRWTVELPRETGSSAVNAPTIDAAGRIYCTTASGTVAVLRPATGALAGLYRSSRPVVTPPVLGAGTACYGCAEADDPAASLDGALHSVVFGETTVLRLGLDASGRPSADEPYAGVEIGTVDVDRHTLHLMDPARSCVEAWVNLPPPVPGSARSPGGGVLGICPTLAGGFDLNLSIGPDGTLRYSARSLRRGVWTALRAEAPTTLHDGRWHHVAVSRDGDDHVIAYVDGQPLTDVLTTRAEDAPAQTVKGIRAYLGAAAGGELQAVNPFCGMIAEVRVWDTCLEPGEIASRMHVKLRGNEPDLLAYWNFDRAHIDDEGPEHHHGELVGAGEQPVWWLTDLPFEKPQYPFITTVGRMLAQGAGQPPLYEVEFTVHRADGSGIPGHPLDLWYVRRRDDDPVETLFDGEAITGVVAVAQPEPGAPSPDGARRVHSVSTGGDGSVTVLITPLDEGHAPAIDLRAGFMPRNERFHVNVLLDKQVLVAPIPPSLVAQSKLVQDYAYSSGGTIDADRDRSTWRTVIRAQNADGSLRVGEPLSVWCAEQCTVDVAGRSYAINPENAAELVTDSQGEAAIVFDAAALTAPSLMVRAGFMHRNDRVVIAPDQDLHRTLSTVSGADLTANRPTRWRPGMKEGQGEPLLAGDYGPHADKVADAIVTVMAAARPAGADAQAAPRGGAQLLRARARAGRRLLTAESDQEPMRQPAREPGGDRVVLLRTMGRAPAVVPVNPAGVRAALAQNAGFVFETATDARGKPAVRFEMLETRAQVEDERGAATPEPVVLRGLFDDIWDVIVDVAVDIYEGASKIVIAVAEQIEVAIHTLVEGVVKIAHIVVTTVTEAVNAIAGFFEQLGVLIMKAIEFLRALFNWKAILRAKDIIQEVFLVSIEAAKKAVSPARLEAALRPLVGAGSVRPRPGGQSIAAASAAGGEPNSPALDEAKGVQGQMVMQKSRDGGISTVAGQVPDPAAKDVGFGDLAGRIPSLVSGLVGLSPADMVNRLLDAVRDAMDAGVNLFIRELGAMSAVVVELVDAAMKLLRARIHVPFVSELYEWITGSPLTLLDLICLALAVPVHLAHIAVTTLTGQTRTFADDNHDLAARLKAAERRATMPRVPTLAPSPAARLDDVREGVVLRGASPVPKRMDTTWEPLIIVLRSINIAAGLASDALFTKMVSGGGFDPVQARARGLAKVIKGSSGIAASCLLRYMSTPAWEERLESGVTPETWQKVKPEPWMADAIMGVQIAGDMITFGGGFKQLVSPSLATSDPIDKTECAVATAGIGGFIALIWKRSVIMQNAVRALEESGADENLVMQVKLFAARDLSTIIARLPWFMFTETGANFIRKSPSAKMIYGGVTAGRAVAQGISLGTHVVSVYHFGQRP